MPSKQYATSQLHLQAIVLEPLTFNKATGSAFRTTATRVMTFEATSWATLRLPCKINYLIGPADKACSSF